VPGPTLVDDPRPGSLQVGTPAPGGNDPPFLGCRELDGIAEPVVGRSFVRPSSPLRPRGRHARLLVPAVAMVALAGCATSVFALAEGDCLRDPGLGSDSAEVGDVETVECTEDHGLEVMLVAEHEADRGTDYPGDEPLHDQAYKECEKAFPDYVGIDYEDSEYWISTIVPSPDSWGTGDRDLLCLVGPETGTTTGSARDSSE